MKIFRRHSAAMKESGGLPVVRIDGGKDTVYVVGFRDQIDVKLTEVSVIAPGGAITGHVTMGHLDRLGNANHAQPHEKWMSHVTAFEKSEG